MSHLNPRTALAKFFAAATILIPASLQAATITLDWNVVTWTPGELTQSFDIDPANPGNDVTLTVLGATNRISTPISAGTTITGGISPTNRTLLLLTDFVTNLESISVRIDFNYLAGVQDLEFTVHDIDGNLASWQEEIRGISATGDTLPNFAPNQLLRLGATPSFQITGTGLAQLLTATNETGDETNNGSAAVSFGSNLVRTTSFTFGAATTGSFDPITSGVSLGNISYTPNPVPEPTSSLLLLSAVSLAGFFRKR